HAARVQGAAPVAEAARLERKASAPPLQVQVCEPNDQQSVVELRDMVVESLLWMSSPEAFNDPADLQATWVIEGSAGELRTRIDALVKEQEPGLSFKQRERKVLDLMEKPREQMLRGGQVYE